MRASLSLCAVALSAFVSSAAAKTVVITVGHNTTDNATTVFSPPSVVANEGDIVKFNFTQGNHTATQSTFSSPCIPAHITNETINGFDSSFRDAGNGTAITELLVTIKDSNTTIWFFDFNTCAEGGVGGININDSTLETLDGFQRNAIRLNGTDAGDTNSTPSSVIKTGTASAPTSTQSTSDADHALALGGAAILPLIVAALSI